MLVRTQAVPGPMSPTSRSTVTMPPGKKTPRVPGGGDWRTASEIIGCRNHRVAAKGLSNRLDRSRSCRYLGGMQRIALPFGPETIEIRLDDGVDILSMRSPEPIALPAEAIARALEHSIASPSLDALIRATLARKPAAVATVVVSDHTRPVPY